MNGLQQTEKPGCNGIVMGMVNYSFITLFSSEIRRLYSLMVSVFKYAS
jgi:hypothetical protein